MTPDSAQSVRILHSPPWTSDVLCVTHSERPVDFQQCSLEALTLRYSDPDRLPPKTPYSQLKPWRDGEGYHGQITLWSFENNWRDPILLAHLTPRYKPQHTLWRNNQLWTLSIDRIEVYDASLQHAAFIHDPWLGDGHTIVPNGRGALLIACAASDAVLTLDENTMRIVGARRMPESIYGCNYNLKRTDSVMCPHITNDLQLTHLNAAHPHREGVLVSTLIQGAIGWFNPQGVYRELTRGFIGAHGVRVDSLGRIYFCDSPKGDIVTLKPDASVESRLSMDSRWLHDAIQLQGDIWAAAISDHNNVTIFNRQTHETLAVIEGSDFGASTQFLSWTPAVKTP